MAKTKKKLSPAADLALDVLHDFAGSAIYGIAVNCFTVPNNIAPGGVTGLATIINHFSGWPIGMTGFLINIPLLFLALKFLGKKFTIKTLKSVAILSITIDLVGMIVPAYRGDSILAAVFGGVCTGLGLGIIFLRGSTTGGTDILSRLIKLVLPHISIGKLLLAVDGCVIFLAVLTFRNIETALYAFVTMFTSSKIIDAILYGLDMGKMVMVISGQSSEIAKTVIAKMGRGATILKGIGAYSNEERNILMCVVRNPEFIHLKRIVNEIDPKAFMIVTEAGEVIGEGFKPIGNDINV